MSEMLVRNSTFDQSVQSKAPGIADRETPLLRDFWYVAAFAGEVTRAPMRRTILDHDILFFRKQDGSPVAVQNRCPHRSFPLHLGSIQGDRIVCGYHGIEYNADGSCAHVPALNGAPRALRLEAYPLHEDGPFIWIWMGDPAKPDYTRLVRQEWCGSQDWTNVSGYFHVKANYLRFHENLMDLTHFAFLHNKWNFASPENAMSPLTIEELDNGIRQSELHVGVGLSPTYVAATGLTPPFNREAVHTVRGPAIHQGVNTTIDSSDPPQRDTWYFDHMLTPESSGTTHYFWAIARSRAINDTAIDEELSALGAGAFAEDKDALENIEALTVRDKREDFREKILRSDEGGIRVLRMFARMAEAESGEKHSTVAE